MIRSGIVAEVTAIFNKMVIMFVSHYRINAGYAQLGIYYANAKLHHLQ